VEEWRVEDRVLSQTDIQQRADLISPAHGQDSVPRPTISVARLLQELRESRGLSKADLAKGAGVDPSSITRFEQGTRAPERETILQMARAMMLPMVDRDRLLAAGGYRSEVWDDPLLVELAQLLVEPSVPAEAREEARIAVKMAVAYCKLRRLQDD
jgi:transcriptional regulator with XRE-family HTH domain